MVSISVIIVNWNTQDTLIHCLESLYKNTKIPFDVYIIDNNTGKKNTRLETVIRNYKNINIIKNGRNLGFAYAVNQGILSSQGDYVLTLNPDVTVTAGYVDSLFHTIRSDKKIGAVSGKLLSSGNKGILDSTGQIIYKNRFARDRGHREIDANQYQEGGVFGTCAAATLYRREMLEDIKINNEYFDSDFFAYLEDVDLAWRAQMKGWKFYFIKDATAYHQRAVSTKTVFKKTKRKFWGWRNRFLMIIKNDSLLSIVINLPFLLFCPLKSVKMLRKRRVIQKTRIIKHDEVARWFLW
ncbi:MAG: glycosyltransferase family 2 protein [Candidatus Kuenenia sp.]|nr:glycosyltransferase family 2 protein [Candidatus Kuenenia hertensis]